MVDPFTILGGLDVTVGSERNVSSAWGLPDQMVGLVVLCLFSSNLTKRNIQVKG